MRVLGGGGGWVGGVGGGWGAAVPMCTGQFCSRAFALSTASGIKEEFRASMHEAMEQQVHAHIEERLAPLPY